MRTLQKPFSTQSLQQTKFCNHSNITQLEHERRERGFQVFIRLFSILDVLKIKYGKK